VEAVEGILRDLGAWHEPAAPEVLSNQPLLPAAPEDVADALAYAMRFNERGKSRRTGVECASQLAAEQLVAGLARSGFVLMRRPGIAPHDAYPRSRGS